MPARSRSAAPRTARKPLIAVAICVGLALSCGACGRRGALEPPGGGAPEKSALATPAATPRGLPQSIGVGGGSAAPDADAIRAGEELAVSATPPGTDGAPVKTERGAKRGYVIPKQPFFLDPLL